MRRSAMLLGINRKTVARRLGYLASLARRSQWKYLEDLRLKRGKAVHIEFDDLETIEHTKCKPLSVAMAVEAKTRRILAFTVSQMPAKGTLAKVARRRYGFRSDERPRGWDRLFSELRENVDSNARFLSDANPHYPKYVKKYFPKATHETVKGVRGCASGGQGELKRIAFDPLFSLNHTFAMLRANIARLIRRTWCTTKKQQALADHIAIYVRFHNQVLLRA